MSTTQRPTGKKLAKLDAKLDTKKATKKVEVEEDEDLQNSSEGSRIDLDEDMDQSPEKDLKLQEQEAYREEQMKQRQLQSLFTQEQVDFIKQLIAQSKARRTRKTGDEKTLEDIEAANKKKSQQYYHLAPQRVRTKVQSICKSILANSSINKNHLSAFSEPNIQQIRLFVQKVKDNRDYNDVLDLSDYVRNMLEKYPQIENKQAISTMVLDRTLLNL